MGDNTSELQSRFPVAAVSEALIAQDAPAALAFLSRRGSFDPDIIQALGLDKHYMEVR